MSRYEVNFQDGIDCGGAYIKLLTDSADLDLVGWLLFLIMVPFSIFFVENNAISLVIM